MGAASPVSLICHSTEACDEQTSKEVDFKLGSPCREFIITRCQNIIIKVIALFSGVVTKQ